MFGMLGASSNSWTKSLGSCRTDLALEFEGCVNLPTQVEDFSFFFLGGGGRENNENILKNTVFSDWELNSWSFFCSSKIVEWGVKGVVLDSH